MSFEDKKKALFASLESAERSIPVDSVLHQDDNVDYDQRRRTDRDSGSRRNRRSSSERGPIRKFRGKESIFKRPAAPISKCLPMSRVPDFKKNPQKWTKYSLEDVDISDRSNTAAAFSFLREMENKKQDQPSLEATGSESATHGFRGKVKFNRSIKLKSQLEEEQETPPTEEEKPKVKSTKVVMPEYVIGQKVKKPKPVKLGMASSKRDRSKELKLDHLMDEEEDPDGEDDDDEMN
ncbi:AAEL006755-PA [Aedes aegypti]|uniref:U5 small nuclear ribonucleoprotein TSSC4 n=2 Tax=Aedes aegypti TaxID=7159 RepID=A0A1S4FEJ6_AEDAE|nr:protein TSSC4 [Aedes aegypti]EAT41642.1 AAEL006755-PA [Aedes aegypti]